MTDKSLRMSASRDLNFPNFNKEYRGLPTEIRLMIWRYCLCDDLYVNAIMAHSHLTQRKKLQEKPRGVWWNAVVDRSNFNFSIFLLAKQSHLEMMSVSKARVNWIFDEDIAPRTCTALLASLCPLQSHIARGISIATSSITEYKPSSRPDGAGGKLFGHLSRNMGIIAELPHIHELTLRLVRPTFLSLDPSDSRYPQIFHESKFVESSQTMTISGTRTRLRWEMALMSWYDKVPEQVHSYVTCGRLLTVRIEHNGAFEGLRQCFTPPTEILFNDAVHANYLSLAEVDDLEIKLDWPAKLKRFVINITKKEKSGE